MSNDAEEPIVEAIEEAVASFLETAEQLKGTHRLQADELFPPSFMREHTSFESIEDFLRDGDVDPDRDGDWDALADEGLDRHVRDTTAFDSWAEMKDAAKREWMVEQLRSRGTD